jgi:PTS system cellobiose-specific IIA component
MDWELMTSQLIAASGEARSYAMEAIALLKTEDYEGARQKLDKAEEILANAHSIQAEFIQEEADGNPVPISLLMVHAQDHLMNAITINDLARGLVDVFDRKMNGGGKNG